MLTNNSCCELESMGKKQCHKNKKHNNLPVRVSIVFDIDGIDKTINNDQ